jgi:DNA-binding transcriptional ArsR family regulator
MPSRLGAIPRARHPHSHRTATAFIPKLLQLGITDESLVAMSDRASQKRVSLHGSVPLRALASPIRQEIVTALGEGPATVKEIATRLGRTRQALHYHIEQLVAAGIASVVGERGSGPAKERVFRISAKRIQVGAGPSGKDVDAAQAATAALLRLTQREVRSALRRERLRHSETSKIVVMRAKCRLDSRGLAQLQKLIGDIDKHLRTAGRPDRHPTYALTIVLAPVRDASLKRQATA